MIKTDLQVQVSSDDGSSLQRAKLRIIKNLCVVGTAIFLLFTAYDGLSMLQSTMNKEQGIGTVSQAVLYAGFCTGALLLPKYIIKKVGCKVGLVMATTFFIPYIASNFYSNWFTMMPSAVLFGIGASILWGSQSTYFNVSALMYCTLNEARDDLKKQDVKKFKMAQLPKSNQTSVEVLSISRSVEELPGPRSNAGSVGDLSVRCPQTPEHTGSPRFKSTEELTSNELAQRYEKFYESNNETESSLRRKPIMKQNSEDGSVNLSIKRRFSVTMLAGDLESYDKSAGKRISNAREISPVPEISSDNRKLSISFDSVHTLKDENNCSPNRNPRQSAGYIETLQKFAGLESVTARFFGFNGFALHNAQVWSNVLSYYVLHNNDITNVTVNASCACGAQFCNDVPGCIGEGAHAIDVDLRYLLTGISVVLALAAVVLLIILLDPLPSDKEPVTFSFKLMMATFNHCRKSLEQQLLIPISFYIGMLQGFYTADFTKSFVSCAWGTSHVGLVTMYYGIACAVSATTSGMLVKYVGRIPLMVLGQAVNIGVNGLLLMWVPDPSEPHIFYISAAMWGLVLGSFLTLVPAFYGMVFKNNEEAAFGSYYLWSSLGWFLSFSYSDYICTSTKMYVLMAMSTVGMTGYMVAERRFYVKKSQISLKYAD